MDIYANKLHVHVSKFEATRKQHESNKLWCGEVEFMARMMNEGIATLGLIALGSMLTFKGKETLKELYNEVHDIQS